MILTEKFLSGRFKYKSIHRFLFKSSFSPKRKESIQKLTQEINDGTITRSKYDKCPLCGDTEAFLISEVDRLSVPCKNVICKGCGLLFNDSFYSENQLEYFYSNYYGKITFSNKGETSNIEKRISPGAISWKRYEFLSLKLAGDFKNIKTVFEIGTRDGCNLYPFYKAGKEVLGCDFDEKCLELGRKKGLNLIYGGIDSIIGRKRKADLLILSHVFTNFIDLDRTIKQFRDILNPDGIVYLEVPGLFSWIKKNKEFAKEDGWYMSCNNFLSYLLSDHNYHFDEVTLSHFFLRNDFSKVYGDDIVRGIFKNRKSSCQSKKNSFNADLATKKLEYLQSVESDYKSLKFRMNIIFNKFFGKK